MSQFLNAQVITNHDYDSAITTRLFSDIDHLTFACPNVFAMV